MVPQSNEGEGEDGLVAVRYLKEKYSKAREIYDVYLDCDEEDSKQPQCVPKEVTETVKAKFLNLSRNLNASLFQELYQFTFFVLEEFFYDFRRSRFYKELEEEVEKQEFLYEVLKVASFISN